MSKYIIKITYENKDNDIVFYSTKGICFHDFEVAFNKVAIKGSYKRLISAEMIDYNQKTYFNKNAESELEYQEQQYCDACGQALDWSVEK